MHIFRNKMENVHFRVDSHGKNRWWWNRSSILLFDIKIIRQSSINIQFTFILYIPRQTEARCFKSDYVTWIHITHRATRRQSSLFIREALWKFSMRFLSLSSSRSRVRKVKNSHQYSSAQESQILFKRNEWTEREGKKWTFSILDFFYPANSVCDK